MIDSLLPRASSLARLIEQPLDSYIRRQTWREKGLEILTAREARLAQYNPCDEPLAFSSSLGLCRTRKR